MGISGEDRSMYSLTARPVAHFASRLEAGWSNWLVGMKWPSVYLGDRLRVGDFLLLPPGLGLVLLECKPRGQGFVQAAAGRLQAAGLRAGLITEDSPGYARWWAFRWTPPGPAQLLPVPPPGRLCRGPDGLARFVAGLRGLPAAERRTP
jgi:hypothetical protein